MKVWSEDFKTRRMGLFKSITQLYVIAAIAITATAGCTKKGSEGIGDLSSTAPVISPNPAPAPSENSNPNIMDLNAPQSKDFGDAPTYGQLKMNSQEEFVTAIASKLTVFSKGGKDKDDDDDNKGNSGKDGDKDDKDKDDDDRDWDKHYGKGKDDDHEHQKRCRKFHSRHGRKYKHCQEPTFTSVKINIKEVSAYNEAVGWVLLNGTPQIVDLIQISSNANVILVDRRIPPGSYKQIRLKIEGNATGTLDNGKTVSIKVPSGERSGIKLKHHFSIEKGLVTLIALNFDPERSIKELGKSGKYIMHPHIRINGIEEDLVIPAIAILSPTERYSNNLVQLIEVEYADANLNLSSLSVKVNGVEVKNSLAVDEVSAKGSLTFVEGEHTVSASISDLAPNEGIASPVMITVDKTSPVISLVQSYILSKSQTVSVSADLSDLLSGINSNSFKIFVDGALQPGIPLIVGNRYTANIISTEGDHTYRIEIADRAGNVTSATGSLRIDLTPPSLSLISPMNGSSLYTNILPKSFEFIGSSSEALVQASINGINTEVNTNKIEFKANIEVLNAGSLPVELRATDLAGNEGVSQNSVDVIFDNLKPQIQIGLENNFKTKNFSVSVPIVIEDASPTYTKLSVNGTEVLVTGSKNFSYQADLNLEGANEIKVTTEDFAGNIADQKTVVIVRDTTGPILSNISPISGSKIPQLMFTISGQSNEPLSEVTADGLALTVSEDKMSFTGNYVSAEYGIFDIQLIAKDLLGNSRTASINVDLGVPLLVPALVSIQPDQQGRGLVVLGAAGASRPGAKVKVSEGLFGLNSGEVNSFPDGSFSLLLDVFTTATIRATDLSNNESITAQLNYSLETSLSGIVRDSNDLPLPGVTVKIENTLAMTTTNGAGVFSFPTAPSGDQILVVDGSTVPETASGPDRKFFATKVPVNVGIGQDNVIPRVIYLTALLMDGSETLVLANSPTTVESDNAPGVQLSINAGKAQFPDGQLSGEINIQTISSERSTYAVPGAAVPTELVALEPSGLSFKERTELTLPNKMEMPPKTEMAIISLNSSTGTWEIDGIARVTDDGNSVKTIPGQGISHFSVVYAVPLAPIINPIKDPNLDGINPSKESVSSLIELPSFKIADESVSPRLTYNSNWARPTAYFSNYFDIPEQKIEFTTTNSGSNTTYRSVDLGQTCAIFQCWTFWGNLYTTTHYTVTDTFKSWYVPESISTQYFVGSLKAQSVSGGVGEEEGNRTLTEDLRNVAGETSKLLEFLPNPNEELPGRLLISQSVELKDPSTGKFFPSGRYPSLARYQIKLKNMTVTTRLAEAFADYYESRTNKSGSFGTILRERTTSVQSRVLEKFLPSDVTADVLVQNRVESPAGRGWKYGDNQQILNPNGSSIVIEEADGSLATYALNTAISEVVQGGPLGIDFSEAVDLTTSGSVTAVRHVGNNSEVVKINIANGSVGSSSVQNVGSINTSSGILRNANNYFCASQGYSGNFTVTDQSYKTKTKLGGLIAIPNGSIFGTDQREHMVFRLSPSFQKLAGFVRDVNQLGPPEGLGNGQEYNVNQDNIQSLCNSLFGQNCGPSSALATFPCESMRPVRCPPGAICKPWSAPVYPSEGFRGFGGFYPNVNTGFGGSPDSVPVNSPNAIILLGDNDVLFADTGNNVVRRANLTTGSIFIFAGNGQNLPFPQNGGQANATPIYHPKGLAQDAAGNIYISAEHGEIFKVSTSGQISRYAGLPTFQGGILADEGKALELSFLNPTGIFIDKLNNQMFVADTGLHRVMQIDMNTGMAMKVAGTGQCNPSDPGNNRPALLASLCSPTQVAVDANGDLLIVDSGHNSIRKINFSGASNNSTLVFSPSNKDSSVLYKNPDGTFERSYRGGHKAFYNLEGYQTHFTSRDGKRTDFFYDSGWNLIKTKFFTGQEISYNISGGKLNSVVDPSGRATSFNFSDNQLIEVQFADLTKRTMAYNTSGLLSDDFNQKGSKTSYTYTHDFRLASILKPDGTKIEVTSALQAPYGDQAGTLIQDGSPTKSFHSLKDPRGKVTKVVPFLDGAASHITDALGNTTVIERNLEGQTVSVTKPNGLKIKNDYSLNYRDLIKETEVHSETEISYKTNVFDQFGNIISKTAVIPVGASQAYILSRTTSFEYFENGLLKSKQEPNGPKSEYSYNSSGLMIQKKVSNGSSPLITTYDRDTFGRVTKITDSSGVSVAFALDAAGNVLFATKTITNGVLEVTTYQYDTFNRLTKVISPKSEETTYTYSPTGELLSIVDPKGKSTTFVYDSQSRVISKTDTLGRVSLMSYDENGNVKTEQDPKGQVKNFSYDDLNRISQTVTVDGIYGFQYNNVGDITEFSSPHSSISVSYNLRSQPIQQTTTGLGEMSSYPVVPISWSYNAEGNLTGVQTPFGDKNYFYDNLNRLTRIDSFSGQRFDFSFDESGRIQQVSRPGSRTNYSFNGSQLASIIHSADSVTKSYFEYAYDQRNLPTQKRTIAGNIDYQYDQNGQLIGASQPSVPAESFVYDNLGNRTQDAGGSYTYDQTGQRLTEDWQYTYQYDMNGNMTSKTPKDITKEALQFDYNALNQLVRINIFTNPFGQVKKRIAYHYDAQGRRMQRSVEDLINSSKNYRQKFVYNAENIILEFNSQNQNTAKYTHSPLSPDDVLSVEVTNAGVLAGLSQSAGVFYYLKDHLGSVSDVIDGTGSILQRIQYNAFGGIRAVTDASGADIATNPVLNTSFTFTGREKESEVAGLYYYRARYYDSSIGRFLQEDPEPGLLSTPSSFNTKYAYSNNKPSYLNDPSGRIIPILAAIAYSALIGAAVGGLTAALTGGNILQGMLQGAVIGAAATAGGLAGAALGGAQLGLALATGLGSGIGAAAANVIFFGATPAQAALTFVFAFTGGYIGGAYAESGSKMPKTVEALLPPEPPLPNPAPAPIPSPAPGMPAPPPTPIPPNDQPPINLING